MPDPIDQRCGALVKAIRVERGLSQTALARHLGVTFQQVQKYENGSNRISASKLSRIARALNCNVADLFDPIDGGAERPVAGGRPSTESSGLLLAPHH